MKKGNNRILKNNFMPIYTIDVLFITDKKGYVFVGFKVKETNKHIILNQSNPLKTEDIKIHKNNISKIVKYDYQLGF